jgi:hypothetical protein
MLRNFINFLLVLGSMNALFAQTTTQAALIGRWEVLQYAEQGLQVDKKKPTLPQAHEVYRHVQKERARTWYGYDYESADEYSKRRAREFERWELRDSIKEVNRIAEAIETPYYAVFFADSTLALYNKDAATGLISFPESRHYIFSSGTMSLDIYPPGYLPVPGAGWIDKWDVQVLSLTETRMTLFLPQDAEIVELVKTEFKLP